MKPGVRATFWIAGALFLAAIFPLLGLMAGGVLAGMGLHALLATPQLPNERDIHELRHNNRQRLTDRHRNP